MSLNKGGEESSMAEAPIVAALTTYFSYLLLIAFGHIRDFCGKVTGYSRYFGGNDKPEKGYAPLLHDWENFYTRRLYHRIQDAWNRPIRGPPSANAMKVVSRVSNDSNYTMKVGEGYTECVNLGSYNYLGFADDWHTTCKKQVLEALDQFPVNCASPGTENGYTSLHAELERYVAKFVGKQDAIVFNMGYGTNATGLPALMGPGCLVLSDALNHTSIVNGARASGATIRVFKHSNPAHLEDLLRTAVVEGQPRTHTPWRKIVVVVEGVYSMEGEIACLREMLAITKKYKAYMYLDEAHSIGAMGKSGRGVCEYAGVDPAEVDVLMGTFTKSFGAMGGYIAGSREFIGHLRRYSGGSCATPSISPVVAAQILRAFKVIAGDDGTDVGATKLRALRENANYFRQGLRDMGAQVFGDEDSPVIPIMLYNPAKISAFSREALARGLAVVVVGFPATPVLLSRVRFCVSAGHDRETLDKALASIAEVCKRVRVRYASDRVLFG